MSSKLTVGLTGGFGCGKTTVSNMFHELGIDIIDSDQISRELTKKNMPCLIKLTNIFGANILSENGELNRSKLRGIIFRNEEKRLVVEEILHPEINLVTSKRILQTSSIYCIVVIPLLLEADQNGSITKLKFRKSFDSTISLLDRILLINSPLAIRKTRIKERDKISEDEINAIINVQADQGSLINISDDIINNSTNLDSLKQQILNQHQFYLALAQKQNS